MLDDLRRPEHTGDDRCLPCTVVNLAAVLSVAALARRRRGWLAALSVAGVGVALVALRGYVVPYTPRFAPRLVAALGIEDYFGAAHASAAGPTDGPETPAATGSLADDDVDGEALLDALVAAGVLDPDGERVVPDPAFDAEWDAEMDRLADLPTDDLADAAFEVAHAAESYTFEGYVVLSDGSGDIEGERWLSRPVAVAEVAAARALADWVDDRRTRLAAASALRMFLEECPDCGATLAESTTASCCGGYTNPTEEPDDVLVCPECDERVFTFD